MHNIHHLKADGNRLYLSRADGGRRQPTRTYKTITKGLKKYIELTND